MAGIKHHTQTAKPDDPTKDVSANEWNEEHDIDDTSISVAKLSDHNKAGHDALAIDADTVDTKHAADFATAAHSHAHGDLTGVTANQHHAQSHGDADHSVTYEKTSNKDQASGYAGLSASSKLAASQMPTGKVKTTLTFAVVGSLAVGTDKAPTILAPCTLTITKVKLVVKTAPTGANLIVDVNKGGTTIFTTQANRPTITAGNTTGDSGTPDVTALAEGDKLTVDIDQVGSTVAGADLTVEVIADQAVAFS